MNLEFAPPRVQESEQYMDNTHERHLDQIEGQLLELKEAL
jgi:hypothetical protein